MDELKKEPAKTKTVKPKTKDYLIVKGCKVGNKEYKKGDKIKLKDKQVKTAKKLKIIK